MVREGRSKKMRTKMGSKAVRYEERLEKREGRKLAKKCWENVDRYGKNKGRTCINKEVFQ